MDQADTQSCLANNIASKKMRRSVYWNCQAQAAPRVIETVSALLLPHDVFADVLSRLAPRDLSLSRAVYKTWCAVVDVHHLLRTELLPFSLDGIFINFHNYSIGEYFSRPQAGPSSRGF
ncbi:hypothetical protein PR202_gb11477 [Eleusine coracana subsp. coracana]|uniref:F-box domain-containing protein n=1 Tax=Eleusine coracana subsp. coracana TaxID=191504 RepID=A0AAV5EMN5_ELECO|nr:hypothetical protein PR202_gb11477 [Eleusine coracana subsp. coracana]